MNCLFCNSKCESFFDETGWQTCMQCPHRPTVMDWNVYEEDYFFLEDFLEIEFTHIKNKQIHFLYFHPNEQMVHILSMDVKLTTPLLTPETIDPFIHKLMNLKAFL